MEINIPFRINDLYKYRNLKTENNRINLEKKKKIFNKIKNIWNKEINYLLSKDSPLKKAFIKEQLSIKANNDKSRNIKSFSIDNCENNIYTKKYEKKLLIGDENYIKKLKINKYNNLSLNKISKEKEENKNIYNYALNIMNSDFKNKNLKKNQKSIENENAHIVNLPDVKMSNMPPNSFLDVNKFFINLNACLEKAYNKYNKETINKFIKKQKKILYNNSIKKNHKNKVKIEKGEKTISYNEKNENSLEKILKIQPIITNINGNIIEYNCSYDKNSIISNGRFDNHNNSKKEDVLNEHKNMKLPNLIKQKLSNSEENRSNFYRKTFNQNYIKINCTDINSPNYIQNKNNLKYLIIKNYTNLETISQNQNFTKSQSQFSSIKNKNENDTKKYKLDINNKINILLYDIPPPNFYSKEFYYYNIFPNNCGWLIKKCFSHRTKWKECHSNQTNLFHFKWKDVITIKDYIDLGTSKKQIINHFENHSCLSNKYKMFYNFAKFCEINGIDVFKYVPFTITFDYLNYDELRLYQENFKEIFYNINNYLFENDSINNQTYNRNKIQYKHLFPLDDPKMGNKFYCEIPKSHYAGKNLWIAKAPNLNRGRCIKIFNNYNEIIQFLNEIKKGNVYQYDNIKEIGYKNEKIEDKKEYIEKKVINKIGDNDNLNTKINNEKKENNEISQNNINNKDNDKDGKIQDKNEKGDYQSDIIIIQKYIEKPFLYNGRKFDIRIWVLISHKMDVYIFKEGHLKASSVNYNINNNNSFIHLTNYSLQKYNENFSKYETGNEISFKIFQQYLNTLGEGKVFNFRELIFPKFKNIIELTTKSSKNLINQKNKKYCFEIFGYDFMMDEDKNIFLIEINTNPGLEISSEIISILVPRMIEDSLRITVDELFDTEYSEEWTEKDGSYISKYHVDGYDDKENMWEFVCNINKSNDKYICEDYYGFGYHKNYKKNKKKSKK